MRKIVHPLMFMTSTDTAPDATGLTPQSGPGGMGMLTGVVQIRLLPTRGHQREVQRNMEQLRAQLVATMIDQEKKWLSTTRLF